ncbi:MAG: hypothetical protein NTU49_03465 [Gammaproteobacteria bacterium]|nr:hypothetical protein [Gammaproteobacteria bacterium]
MRYLFEQTLFLSIQEAFESAIIMKESVEYSAPDKRDYFFLQFKTQVTTLFCDNIIDIILSGDAKLSELCNQALNSTAKIELGFRWKGFLDDTKKIIFLGFCIKIIYSSNKENLRNAVINQLCDLFRDFDLIKKNHDLVKQFFSLIVARPFESSYFYKLPRPRILPTSTVKAIQDYIRTHISPVLPAYVRPNESGINPAYQDTSSVKEGLQVNQIKIWLFRSDFIVAMGNKNAYWTSFSEKGLSEAISPKLHKYVNWEDHYGHPSLACDYPGYNGSAFYAGLLAQRKGCLEVYTSSGRYYRNDLNEGDKKIIEAYLAYEFQKTFGEQTIIFIDALSHLDYFECSLFYNNEILPDNFLRRKYDFNAIQSIFQEMNSGVLVVNTEPAI